MKFQPVILFFAVTVICVSAFPWDECKSSSNHDLDLGNREMGDRILYSTHEIEKGSMVRVKSKDVQWPLPYQISNAKITKIEIRNQLETSKAGCAYLKNGGPGSNNALIHVKTQRGGAYDFLIIIYGK